MVGRISLIHPIPRESLRGRITPPHLKVRGHIIKRMTRKGKGKEKKKNIIIKNILKKLELEMFSVSSVLKEATTLF